VESVTPLDQKAASDADRAVPASRYILFLSIVAAGCLADLATKHWAFRWLGMPHENPPWWLWENVVGMETSLNTGALFGLGQGWTPAFAALSVLAAGAIALWLFAGKAARDVLLTVALALVTAGILGNLYDRLGLHGLRWPWPVEGNQAGDPIYAVRDWIKVMIFGWPWPNFNIADSMLVCGVGLLGWHACRPAPDARPTQDPC